MRNNLTITAVAAALGLFATLSLSSAAFANQQDALDRESYNPLTQSSAVKNSTPTHKGISLSAQDGPAITKGSGYGLPGNGPKSN